MNMLLEIGFREISTMKTLQGEPVNIIVYIDLHKNYWILCLSRAGILRLFLVFPGLDIIKSSFTKIPTKNTNTFKTGTVFCCILRIASPIKWKADPGFKIFTGLSWKILTALFNTRKLYCNQHTMFTRCILFFILTTKA